MCETMSRTRPATANSLVDCHFFITSRCDRRNCDFRHNKSVLTTTTVCPAFVAGECRDPDACSRRHPLICRHDQKGCTSISCPYHHLNPNVVDGTLDAPVIRNRTQSRPRHQSLGNMVPPAVQSRSRARSVTIQSNHRADSLHQSYGPPARGLDPLIRDIIFRIRSLCLKRNQMPGSGQQAQNFERAIQTLAHSMRPAYEEFLNEGRGQRDNNERDDWFDDRWVYIQRDISRTVPQPLIHSRPQPPVRPAVVQQHQRQQQAITPVVRPTGIIRPNGQSDQQVHVGLAAIPRPAVAVAAAQPQPRSNPGTSAGASSSASGSKSGKKKEKKVAAKPVAASAATADLLEGATGGPADWKHKTVTELLTQALKNVLIIGGNDDPPSGQTVCESESSDDEIESFEHSDSYYK